MHRFAGETMGSTYEVKFVGQTPISQVREVVLDVLEEFDLARVERSGGVEVVQYRDGILPLLRLAPADVRREGAALDRPVFDAVVARARRFHRLG